MAIRHYISADNQDITRIGLNSVIRKLCLAEYISEISSKQQLTALLKENPEAIVILDYTLFDFSRIEELINLHERFPFVRWILFSEDLTTEFLHYIYPKEAFNILFKNASIQEISKALRDTASNRQYICPQIEALFQHTEEAKKKEFPALTTTEKDILKLIAQGKSVKEIAGIRISSTHTITTHKKNIFRKLNVNNVHEATRYAIRAGLIDIAEYCI